MTDDKPDDAGLPVVTRVVIDPSKKLDGEFPIGVENVRPMIAALRACLAGRRGVMSMASGDDRLEVSRVDLEDGMVVLVRNDRVGGYGAGRVKMAMDEARTRQFIDRLVPVGQDHARREMLLPRFVCRVGTRRDFAGEVFADPRHPFAFATEPEDIAGLSPARAMYSTGWPRPAIEARVGEEIVVTVLDTVAPVGSDPARMRQVEMEDLGWEDLIHAALDDRGFVAEMTHAGLGLGEVVRLFGLAANRAMQLLESAVVPAAEREVILHHARRMVGYRDIAPNPWDAERLQALRGALFRCLGVGPLFTGIGLTLTDSLQLGAQETSLRPNGTGFALTADNHDMISLGALTREDFERLPGCLWPRGEMR